MTPNYLEQFKTKEEAIQHIFSQIIETPGCAGDDGICRISWGGGYYALKPLKRKPKEE